MASANTRQIAMEPWATNLPIIPRVLAAPVSGETYPSGRVIDRGSMGDGTGTNADTWIAVIDSGFNVVLDRVGSAIGDFRGAAVNSASSPVGIVYTGGRPRNPNGGVPGYTVNIGTAELTDGVPVIASNDCFEDRQPILDGNTLVECRKIPPRTAGSSGVYFSLIYANKVITPINNAIGDGQAWAARWIGGDLGAALSFNAGVSADVYVVPISAFTGDVSAAVNVGTVTDGASIIITAATLAGAGLVIWDPFWVIPVASGGPADPASSFVAQYFVGDLPSLYDCPGYDIALLKGGYIP